MQIYYLCQYSCRIWLRLILSILVTGYWGGDTREQVVSEGHVSDVIAKRESVKQELKALAPYSNFSALLL